MGERGESRVEGEREVNTFRFCISDGSEREFQLRCKNSGKVDVISSFFVSVGRV